MESKTLFIFYSLAASIFKYSSTSSTRVNSFFYVTLGVLFLVGYL